MTISKDFENGVDKISQEVSKAAENVKETASDFGGWWKKTSTETKVSTFIGVVLLVWGLWNLKGMIFGVVLVTLGIFCAMGRFDKPLKNFFNWCSTTCKKKSSSSSKKSEEKLEKVDVEEEKK